MRVFPDGKDTRRAPEAGKGPEQERQTCRAKEGQRGTIRGRIQEQRSPVGKRSQITPANLRPDIDRRVMDIWLDKAKREWDTTR